MSTSRADVTRRGASRAFASEGGVARRTWCTCAGLVDDSLNHEADEGVVLHATDVTLRLLARRIRQLGDEVQDLEDRLPG
ncbi:hypothetical protein ACWDE0_00455 [Streptomyces sp. 900105755]